MAVPRTAGPEPYRRYGLAMAQPDPNPVARHGIPPIPGKVSGPKDYHKEEKKGGDRSGEWDG